MDKRERLLELIRENTTKSNVKLSSGRSSNYYIDCRMVTLNPEGAALVAEILFDILKDENIDAVGGLTLGADPICGAFSVISYQKGRPIPTFIVRKEKKEHGRQKRIEGNLKKGSKVAIIDDVATTGNSLLTAINAVAEEGCRVQRVIVIVDRNEGAKEKLSEKGYELESIFRADEILKDELKTS